MKLRNVLVAVLVGWALSLAGAGRAEAVSVLIDGRPLAMSQPPVSEGGRLLVPLRSIFEGLGASVVYDPATRQVHATRGATTVDLTMGSTQASVNGAPVTLDVPPQIIHGSTLVPLRFVSQALGATVHWMAASQTVLIASAGAPPVSSAVPLPPAYNPVSVQTSGPIFVNVAYPSSGQTVATDFRVRGTTRPYATVLVTGTVERPIVGHVVIPGVGINTHTFSMQGRADALGRFSVPVHLGRQPGGSQLVLRVKALDEQGRASDQIRFTVGVGD